MGMQVLGMHLPNKSHRRDADLMHILGDTGPVTMLHEQVGQWYWRLRDTQPTRLIHVRIYREWWQDEDPRKLAEWFVQEFSYLLQDPRILLSPANEQNIELVGGKTIHDYQGQRRIDLYEHIGQWNLAFWRRLDQLVPERKCLALWSALADGHDARQGVPDSEYQIAGIRAALAYVDVLASHPYAKLRDIPDSGPGGSAALWHMRRPWRAAGVGGPNDPGGMLTQFPGRPHFVSETGTFTHDASTYEGARDTYAALVALAARAAVDGRTLGITPFIWSSGPEHAHNVIADNDDLVAFLRGAPRHESTARVPVASTATPTPPAPAPKPPASGLANGYRPHVVRRGETLWGLAGRRWRECRVTVPLEDARQLEVGAVVMIPEDIK